MKNLWKTLVVYKMQLGMIYIGLLILFALGKAVFYNVYSIESLDLIWLLMMALIITVLKAFVDLFLSHKKIGIISLYIGFGILMVGMMFFFNEIFQLFDLTGIQYLYFGLIVSGCYLGASFGFWIIERMDINTLNIALKNYK